MKKEKKEAVKVEKEEAVREEEVKVGIEEEYFFSEKQKTIKARSREEAEKIYNRENK